MRSKSDEVDSLKSLLDGKCAEYESLSSLKDDIEKQLEQERARTVQLQEQLSSLTTEDNRQLISVQQELAVKEANLNELTKKLSNVEQQVVAMQGNLELAEQQLRESESEKISLADEVGELKAERDGLIDRIEEMEQETVEERENFEQQLQALKDKLKQKEDEVLAAKSGSEKLENEASTKLMEQTQQVAHLDAVNQKLRDEFLQKEAVVGELQKKIEQLTAVEKEQLTEIGTLKANLSRTQEQLENVERQLKNVRDDAERLRDEAAKTKSQAERLDEQLKESCVEQERLKNRLIELEDEYENKQEEDGKIRDQYALALKNSNDHLEEAQKQLAELDMIRIEKDRLAAELVMAKEECAKATSKAEEETDQAVSEIKRKAEIKVGKIKKQCEADVQAAKAELLLQLSDMRSQIEDRDVQIDEFKLTVAELQQKLIDEGENEKIINDLRSNIEVIAAERDNNATKLGKLQAEMDGLRAAESETKKRRESETTESGALKTTIKELESRIEQLKAKCTQSDDLEARNRELMKQNAVYDSEIKELQARVTKNEEVASEQLRVALAKADGDRQRMLRDLQKEIKQLYHDLNERTEQLTEANTKIESLASQTAVEEETMQKRMLVNYAEENRKRKSSADDEVDEMDVEELHELRQRVLQYKKEVAEMKEAHRIELAAAKKEALQTVRNSDTPNKNLSNGTITVDVSSAQKHMSQKVNRQNSYDLSPSFAEPTEAEVSPSDYLKVFSDFETLARVIGTVAKFSREQLDAVVAKEEERNHSWYGGTMSTVQGLMGSALASGR
ncbi:unnamed protein product [Toxocara canis]|uniref:GRIP domain-containing protein n=1 Tax=Toxocara canis TaxID=6265 RepID=A0A183UHC3_TOXCA|nr:unnamed protein product [Toxocara canis]